MRTSTPESLDRSRLRSRYLFEGLLVLDTALHVGGGPASMATDSAVVRDGLGRPFIPGSSIKGAFRAAVERLAPNVPGLRSCQLMEGWPGCLSTNKELSKAYGRLSDAAGRGIGLGVGESESAKEDGKALEALGKTAWIGREISERDLLEILSERLCDTCKVFGSVHLAATAQFHDLHVSAGPLTAQPVPTQIRDGVGIDRDSERAIDQIKFDYEVVPAQTAFDFRLTLENPSELDRGLVAIGLLELGNGMIPLGGIRTRGLGRCHLEDLRVSAVDFTKTEDLVRYLSKGPPEAKLAKDFLEGEVAALLAAE